VITMYGTEQFQEALRFVPCGSILIGICLEYRADL
jgi:hypothetical protein